VILSIKGKRGASVRSIRSDPSSRHPLPSSRPASPRLASARSHAAQHSPAQPTSVTLSSISSYPISLPFSLPFKSCPIPTALLISFSYRAAASPPPPQARQPASSSPARCQSECSWRARGLAGSASPHLAHQPAPSPSPARAASPAPAASRPTGRRAWPTAGPLGCCFAGWALGTSSCRSDSWCLPPPPPPLPGSASSPPPGARSLPRLAGCGCPCRWPSLSSYPRSTSHTCASTCGHPNTVRAHRHRWMRREPCLRRAVSAPQRCGRGWGFQG
jgi:hypothetical protein